MERDFIKRINGENYVDADILSEMLHVPKQVLCWTIENEPQMICGEDYRAAGKQKAQNIGLKALIFVLDKFCSDYNAKANILSAYMYSGNSKTESESAYAELQQKHEKLTSVIMDALQKWGQKTENAENNKKTKTPNQKYKRNSNQLPELTEEESTWQKEMSDLLQKTAAKLNTTPMTVMHRIYSKMTNTYGVVFSEEKKSARYANELDDGEHVSTLYIVTKNKQYRSIYGSILQDMYNNN